MERTTLSNYEITRNATEAKFPEYDQEQIISRFHLKNDGEYIYVNFVGREYRISRQTGKVEYFSGLEGGYCHADFNVVLTIFDVCADRSRTPFCQGILCL